MGKFRKAAGALVAAGALAGFSAHLRADTVYYDTNGATAGTGATEIDWNSGNTTFTTDSTGSSATEAFPGDSPDVFFSAGTNAPSYTINCAGSKTANSYTVDQGSITLHTIGGSAATRTINAGGITLDASTSGETAVGPFTFIASTGTQGVLTTVIGATQSWTSNNASANFVVGTPLTGNAATGTNTLTFAGINTANDLITGIVSDGTAGGNVGLAANLTGGAALELRGVNTYSGGTTVTSGEILLDSGGSLAHSNITITGGEFASGTGGGTLTDNFSSGNSETISVSGTGVLDLDGLTLAFSGTPTQSSFVFATASNASELQGSFAAVPAGYTASISGNQVIVSSVPEPASLGMIGAGVLGLVYRRRR